MTSPFKNRTLALNDPKRDIISIVPDDNADLGQIAIALYIESGGDLTFVSEAGHTRSLKVADFAILPVGVRRVLATGTNATGIHAMVN
jgi:hypothetical protein